MWSLGQHLAGASLNGFSWSTLWCAGVGCLIFSRFLWPLFLKRWFLGGAHDVTTPEKCFFVSPFVIVFVLKTKRHRTPNGTLCSTVRRGGTCVLSKRHNEVNKQARTNLSPVVTVKNIINDTNLG